MKKTAKRWTSVYTAPSTQPQKKALIPFTPCTGKDRHSLIRSYLPECGGQVCLWCSPGQANVWGCIIDELLSEEQLELVQALRREEK
jgi:hypothetical protein